MATRLRRPHHVPRRPIHAASGWDAKAHGAVGQPRKWPGRTRRPLRQRRPPGPRPVRRRLWLRRRRRPPRRRPHKSSSRTGRQSRQPRPSRASTGSAPLLAQTPKPNATRTASVSNKSAEPSTPKVEFKEETARKLTAKVSKSAKASAKPIPRPSDDRPSRRRRKKRRNRPSPRKTSAIRLPRRRLSLKVQQRVADGVTHAFGYLVHLPGALIPHLGGPNPDAH